MNRNVLKIIALISMIIDHVGMVFFPNIYIFRIIGRVAMPIFAFFIAEGFYYTKNRTKYILTLLIFMILSWIPFNLALGFPLYTVNILGVFLLSILGMCIVDIIKNKKQLRMFAICTLVFYLLLCFIFGSCGIIPESVFGVAIPILFYAFRDNKWLKYSLVAIVLVVMSIISLLDGYTNFLDVVQFFSLMGLLLLMFYNGNKGKYNIKYLFYVGYPAHLIILFILKLII